MSKINDLIAEYCPDGVEFHSISEIFDLKKWLYAIQIQTGVLDEWDRPVVSYGRYSSQRAYSL